MQPTVRDSYLETEIKTATPQKLQYMLIDAAVKRLQRGKLLWTENRDDAASEALIRAQEIVSQILAGLNREVDGDLARRVAAIYMFVFRTLNAAQLRRDEEKLDECLRVLEVERETWRLVCEKLDHEQGSDSASAGASLAPSAPPAPSRPPGMPLADLSDGPHEGGMLSSGFSLEA